MASQSGPVTTMAEAIDRMQSICDGNPHGDGAAAFTWMYLQVTKAVATAVTHERFAAPAWMARLDVVFANLFFQAYDAGEAAPRAWRPLFQCRADSDVLPLQFALAGMNAHINRDLSVALVQTCENVGVELHDPSPQHDDYLVINRVLAEVEPRVRAELVVDLPPDEAARLADRLAIWNIANARNAAWVQAEVLWLLRGVPDLQRRCLDAVDGTVGLGTRALLARI